MAKPADEFWVASAYERFKYPMDCLIKESNFPYLWILRYRSMVNQACLPVSRGVRNELRKAASRKHKPINHG